MNSVHEHFGKVPGVADVVVQEQGHVDTYRRRGDGDVLPGVTDVRPQSIVDECGVLMVQVVDMRDGEPDQAHGRLGRSLVAMSPSRGVRYELDS
jgi:hypothetical protein